MIAMIGTHLSILQLHILEHHIRLSTLYTRGRREGNEEEEEEVYAAGSDNSHFGMELGLAGGDNSFLIPQESGSRGGRRWPT